MGDDITIGVTEIVNTIEVTAQPNDQIVDINITDNTDNVTLNITPTVVEINVNKGVTSRWGNITGTLSDQDDLQGELDLKADLVDGKVPASQLPSYVDDVVEVANYAALPATGESGKIYITLNNNKIYRWTGSTYVEIADSAAVWGAITGTLSDQTDLQNALNGKQDDLNGTGIVKSTSGTISYLTDNSTNWDAAYNDKINSAEVTGTNTKTLTLTQQDGGTVTASWSDINSGVWGNISGTLSNQTDLQQTLNTKEGTISGGTTSQYWRGDKSWQNLNSTAIGLGNVNNTSDADKPISTATQTALNAKVPTSRVITINGFGYDLTSDVNFTVPSGVWGGITGALSNQTDLYQTLNTKMPADRAITINGVTQTLTQDRTWTIGTAWGGITGTLANQTDLQTALNTKVPTSRTITINGVGYDLSANVNFNIGVGVWGQITGTLSNQTDLYQTLNTKMPADRAITINGVTQSLTQDRSWTISTIGGTGTNGYVAFWNGTSNQAGDSNLFWDNTNKRLGIGTTSPSNKLVVDGGSSDYTPIWAKSSFLASSKYYAGLYTGYALTSNQSSQFGYVYDTVTPTNSFAHITPYGSAEGSKFTVRADGNVGIGTPSPDNGKLTILKNTSNATESSYGIAIQSNASNAYTELLLGADDTVDCGVIQTAGKNTSFTSKKLALQPQGGNVGIGTTSPGALLDVNGSIYSRSGSILSNNFGGYSGSDVNFTTNTSGGANLIFSTVLTERMRITSGGNVGIGTTSPTIGKLQINAVAGTDTFLALNSSNTGSGCGNILFNENGTSRWNIGTTADNSLQIYNQGVNAALYIRKSDSNVGIGTTSPNEKLHVVGKAAIGQNTNGTAVIDAYGSIAYYGCNTANNGMGIGATGAATFSSTVTATGFFNSSDNRLKDLTDYDYNVSDIKPITYLWKDGRDNKKHVGYSAQEVQKVMPDAVNEGTDGMLSVNYVEILVAKISQMEKEIELLKSK